MATIFDMYERAKAANSNAKGVTVGIIEDHSDVLTDLNKDQLKRGTDSIGEKIHPMYGSIIYSIEKNNKNPLAGFGTPDLNLTGAFYRGFYLLLNGMSFKIDSNDSKTGSLKDKYGDIFGLSDSSLSTYTKNYFFEEFKSFIEKTLKLKMQ